MALYKIKNITNTLDKRHPQYKKVVQISYNENYKIKTININVGETIFFDTQNLPITVRSLMLKKIIIVEESDYSQIKNNKVENKKNILLSVEKNKIENDNNIVDNQIINNDIESVSNIEVSKVSKKTKKVE